MKSGAGDDPFAEETGDEGAEGSERGDSGDTDSTPDTDPAQGTDGVDRGDGTDGAGNETRATGVRSRDAGGRHDDPVGDVPPTGRDGGAHVEGTGNTGDAANPVDRNELVGDRGGPTDGAGATDDTEVESTDGGPRDIDIPWVLRRGSVKDDRPNVTQFFLRDETDAAERRFKSEVEDRLDTDVYTLDLREAAYLVAMRHSDEVAQQLRDWGYDYLD